MTIISSLQGKEKPTSGSPTKRTQYVLSEPSTDDTSDGEVADHDSYHVEKKRRLTGEQVRSLEMSFEVENKLEAEKKLQLAQELGLQPRQVAIWFQNRRARWKTKQLEKDYDILKAAYESLLSEREKLQAEIASLNVKLETSSRKSGLEAKRNDADDQSKSTILNDHLAWKPASNKLDKAEILMLKQANADSEELQLHSPVTSDDASFDSNGGSSVNNNFEQRTRGQSANRLCPIGVDFEHKTVCVLPCVHHISFKQEDGCGHEESFNNSFFTLDEHGGWPWYWD